MGRGRERDLQSHLPIDGPSCSEIYRSVEASSFARDDVVGRWSGAASGLWGTRRWYSLAAAGRNRGDESGVRLEYHLRAPRTSPRGPPRARGEGGKNDLSFCVFPRRAG